MMPDTTSQTPTQQRPLRATAEPAWVRRGLIGIVLLFLGLFLLLPLVVVFQEAFRKGIGAFIEAFQNPDTTHSVQLTLIVAAIVVPLNTVFGVAAAWAITRFDFRGKRLLTTLVELPLWVSPVIAGLIFVLLFGAHGWFGGILRDHGIRVLFALPGIVLGTLFVTVPFVARVLIPLMQQQGVAEEEAAMTLGARGWQLFFLVTLPKIKWGLLYGVILCNARAMGEFGAVSVLSGHISGATNTMPLHIEILYNEFHFTAAFAVASVLSLLALASLGLKTWVERKGAGHQPH